MNVCSNEGCRGLAQRRGMCWKHYYRRRRLETATNTSNWNSTPLSWCRCEVPVPGVIALTKPGWVEREPRPGDMVECRNCRRPLQV